VLSLIGVIIVLAIRHDKKRTEDLAAAAGRMNFTFSKEASPHLLRTVEHFQLFARGHSKKIRNVFTGKAGDLDVSVFDYRYTTGSGKNSNTARQTVMLFESNQLEFPQFALRPEHLFHKIGQVFGYTDIDFDTHPGFSKRYLLRGEDENAVRSTFNREALAFYETDRTLSTEAHGRQLIHYRAAKRVSAEQVQEFIAEGVRVLTLLRR
jgi:hypothetical protein